MSLFTIAPQGMTYHANMACYICGVTTNLIDTSVQIEGEGVLAICPGCVAGMARAAGFTDPDADAEIEQLATLVERQAKDLNTAKNLEKRLRVEIRDAKRERDNLRGERNELHERLQGTVEA